MKGFLIASLEALETSVTKYKTKFIDLIYEGEAVGEQLLNKK